MYELLKSPLEIVRITTHQPEGDNGPCHMWTCPLTTRCVGAIVERIFQLTNHLSSLHEIIAIIQGFPVATTRGMDGVFQYLCHDLCCIAGLSGSDLLVETFSCRQFTAPCKTPTCWLASQRELCTQSTAYASYKPASLTRQNSTSSQHEFRSQSAVKKLQKQLLNHPRRTCAVVLHLETMKKAMRVPLWVAHHFCWTVFRWFRTIYSSVISLCALWAVAIIEYHFGVWPPKEGSKNLPSGYFSMTMENHHL